MWWTARKLKSRDKFVRTEAALALARRRDPRSLVILRELLHDRDSSSFAREEAAVALGVMRDRASVELLIGAMHHSPLQTGVILDALQAIGDQRAIAPILELLRVDLSAKKYQTLIALGWQPSSIDDRAVSAVALEKWDEALAFGPQVIRYLVPLVLRTHDENRRTAAALLLGQLGDDGINALAGILREHRCGMGGSIAAAKALVAAGAPGIEGMMQAVVEECFSHDPKSAMRLLISLGATEPFLILCRDPDPMLRQLAIQNIEKVAGSSANDTLIAALQDPHPGVRTSAARALRCHQDERAVYPLTLRLEQDESPEVRCAAGRTLVQIAASEALEPLVAARAEWKPFFHEARRLEAVAGYAIDDLLVETMVGCERLYDSQLAASELESRSWRPRNDSEGAWFTVLLGRVEDIPRSADSVVPLLRYLRYANVAKGYNSNEIRNVIHVRELAQEYLQAITTRLQLHIRTLSADTLADLSTLKDLEFSWVTAHLEDIPAGESYTEDFEPYRDRSSGGYEFAYRDDVVLLKGIRAMAREELSRRRPG